MPNEILERTTQIGVQAKPEESSVPPWIKPIAPDTDMKILGMKARAINAALQKLRQPAKPKYPLGDDEFFLRRLAATYNLELKEPNA